MTVVHTFYPHQQLPSGEQPLAGSYPVCLIVCLPPEAGHDPLRLGGELADRLRPHTTACAPRLYTTHYPLRRCPDRTEARLLLALMPDPQPGAPSRCAGGPIGLLDLAATTRSLRESARNDVEDWRTVIAGTPPARPWWHYLDAHHSDPDAYPIEQAVAQFEAQARITAMATAPGTPAGAGFPADLYGPGLEAMDDGPDTYADYRAGLLSLGDGLLTLDGQLQVPSFSPVLVEQSLAERQVFHDRARAEVAALDPRTLLAAVRCLR